MSNQGVVTLCDQNYFPGLLKLHESIRTSRPYPVACYDIGLTAEQREAAEGLDGLQVLPLPDDRLIASLRAATERRAPLRKPNKRLWPLWICPLLIRAAPFEEVFWLDTDLLVLRGLHELFAELQDGPVFTPENRAPQFTPNSPRLYELLPIARSFDPALPTVNAGVSGWSKARDHAALEAYIRPVQAAAQNPDVMDAISWHDQGALIWAIQALGLEHRVMASPTWNLCVEHVDLPASTMRWDDGLCARLRDALPEVGIVHWNGRPAPWTVAASP